MKKSIHAGYQSQQDQKYLTLSDECLTGEEYELKMLMMNDLPEYLKVSVRSFNGEPAVWYNISGMQTLEKMLGHQTMDAGTLEALLRNIEGAIAHADEYLLTDADLLMEPSYIYCQGQRDVFRFVYYPKSGSEEERPYEKLAEFILKRLSHSDTRALELGYQFYEGAASDNFSFTNLMADIKDGKTQLLRIPAFSGDSAEKSSEPGKPFYDKNPHEESKEGKREIRKESGEKSAFPGVYEYEPYPDPYTDYAGRHKETGISAGKNEKRKMETGNSKNREKAGQDNGQNKKSRKETGGSGLLLAAVLMLAAGIYLLVILAIRPDLQTAGGLACVMGAGAFLVMRLAGKKKEHHNVWVQEEDQEDEEDDEDLAFLDELMQNNYDRKPGRKEGSRPA